MIIAVNTRFLLAGRLEGYGYFIHETFRRITRDHPEHQFIFIFDRSYERQFVFEKNVLPLLCGPSARHPILWKFWYDVRVPSLLKKYKADVFVSPDGFCSLATRVPQCLVLHDLAFLHHPGFIKRSHLQFYKKYIPKFLKKAASIATVSDYSLQDIRAHYDVDAARIRVVSSAAREIFQPIGEQEKQQVKDEYCEGKEYFFYAGAIHPRKNLLNLLKAFSVFKKRQQSNMKLVLAGRLAWKYNSFTKSLGTYKYRDDVLLTGYIPQEELARIMGAAYALLYVSHFEGFGVPVLEAMQCGLPVITSAGSAMQEIAGDAALYADPQDHQSIAEKMMHVYKDEDLRKKLISAGRSRAKEFSWDRTAALLWQSIQDAAR